MLRAGGLLILILLIASASFANSPAKSKHKKNLKSTTAESSDSSSTEAKTTDAANPGASSSATVGGTASSSPAAAAAPQKSSSDPAVLSFNPVAATTGTLGLFTTETAQTLPKGAFSLSGFANKFGQMPGSVTVLETGFDAGFGLTDWLNVYAQFDPWGHVHTGVPGELSLSPVNAGNPLFPGQSLYPTVGFTGLAAYIQDYPFVTGNSGGIGDFTVGFKVGLLSEDRGAPLSVSFRNDFIFPTRYTLAKLEANGTQTGGLADLASFAISKRVGNFFTPTLDLGYLFTREPRPTGQFYPVLPHQARLGAGFLFLPQSRFEPMMEYNAVVYTGGGSIIPDYTFGARDPIDGVWGFRYYFNKYLALDLGYRYMLNLGNLNDRNGFVIKLGGTRWSAPPPPPPPAPPTVSCAADKSQVFQGSNDVVNVTATANSPAGLPLTYTWMATGGSIDGTGPQVRWNSTGTAVGNYTVTAHVDDSKGGAASCTATIMVVMKPIRPPTVSLSADRTMILVGERSHITSTVGNPDNAPLTYMWRANGGQVIGNGVAVDWDSTGVTPGTYTITLRVENAGGAADASINIQAQAPPPPPQASKISDCTFTRNLSTRIDNVCKRVLDDVALRLQNDPRANIVIIGYSDPRERNGDKIAGDRAANAVKYLGDKGVSASRAQTRTGAGQAGATDNRRLDIIWVPEGATY